MASPIERSMFKGLLRWIKFENAGLTKTDISVLYLKAGLSTKIAISAVGSAVLEEGIDACAWVKPPGKSDGVSSAGIVDPDDPKQAFDIMFDPDAQSVYNPA